MADVHEVELRIDAILLERCKQVESDLAAKAAIIADLKRIVGKQEEELRQVGMELAAARAEMAVMDAAFDASTALREKAEEEARKWEWVARAMAAEATHWTPEGPDAFVADILARYQPAEEAGE